MGITPSSVSKWLFPKPIIKVLLVGISGAGKTVLLYKLLLNEVLETIPTIGFNCEKIECKDFILELWDFPGTIGYQRHLWVQYYKGLDFEAVIYVIDASEKIYIDESKKSFFRLITSQEKDVILLIFANKQDVPGAYSAAEIVDIYGIRQLPVTRWHIQEASPVSEVDGLHSGIAWLENELNKSRSKYLQSLQDCKSLPK